MPVEVVRIVRYPNRRFYDRQASKYVSLQDIEQTVSNGRNVEILDSQTNEDLTRSVLTRIIMDRQPEKMKLFPVDLLHCILRSNDVMSGFLRDYFRQSLTYLSYLQQHKAPVGSIAQPMHWMRVWLDGITSSAGDSTDNSHGNTESELPSREELVGRIAQLEERLRLLEQKDNETA